MITVEEIKEKLSVENISIVSIAKKFNCTPSNVHQLFRHKATKTGKPSLIRKYIAEKIGVEYSEIWG